MIRHQNQLKQIEMEKKLQQEDFEWRLQAEKEIEIAEKATLAEKNNQLVTYLKSQIEHEREKKQIRKQEQLQIDLNNLKTAEENSLSKEEELLMKENQQKMLRIQLLKQMQAAENEKLQKQLAELNFEQSVSKQIQDEVQKHQELEEKNKFAEQEHYRKTWDT